MTNSDVGDTVIIGVNWSQDLLIPCKTLLKMPSFLPHVTLSVLSIKREERSLLDRSLHRARDRQIHKIPSPSGRQTGVMKTLKKSSDLGSLSDTRCFALFIFFLTAF